MDRRQLKRNMRIRRNIYRMRYHRCINLLRRNRNRVPSNWTSAARGTRMVRNARIDLQTRTLDDWSVFLHYSNIAIEMSLESRDIVEECGARLER